jgi:hypothetical protein
MAIADHSYSPDGKINKTNLSTIPNDLCDLTISKWLLVRKSDHLHRIAIVNLRKLININSLDLPRGFLSADTELTLSLAYPLHPYNLNTWAID